MEPVVTLENVQALQQLALSDEHLMICLCGVDTEQDADAHVLQKALQKIMRIKMQMGSNERQATSSFRLLLVYRHVKQNVFDELCAYDSTNPLAKFYFLEVGESVERLHQVLVLMLSHPAHRLGQNAAEQLLGSWFSPSSGIDSRLQD
ncbi:hypothetical protein PHMEG_00014565 [Phytophthora megakarya]|uniref:Uncharacterized protein n=1 Tax=Phytophthora megakarya TaxID=4795 RepID=A0A225W411_9STRA|nr:hypothetical protein PHMEG_00014565 [Phytophthora megakarya]